MLRNLIESRCLNVLRRPGEGIKTLQYLFCSRVFRALHGTSRIHDDVD
jgi:hypothetical protein